MIRSSDIRTCACGHSYDRIDARYVGAQELGDGEIALLFTCPGCKTTYADGVLRDAAVCSECRHAIVGDHEDRKIAALVKTTCGVESRVFCEDCDDKGGLRRRTYGAVQTY